MTRSELIQLQTHVGTLPDGFWGPKSEAATRAHLSRLADPAAKHWPQTDQRSLSAFYGSPGDESQLVNLPVPVPGVVLYDGRAVRTIRCHHRVADSLGRVVAELAQIPQGRAVLGKYAGCYAHRVMRGGSTPSLHARGAAIDLDPAPNGNRTHWPTRATMSLTVMECFAREGWLSAGAFWSRDAMHFQATQ